MLSLAVKTPVRPWQPKTVSPSMGGPWVRKDLNSRVLQKVATPMCYLDNYNKPISNVHPPSKTLNKLHAIPWQF